MPLEVSLTNEQKLKITANPKTEAGKPAEIEPGSLMVGVSSGDSAASLVDGEPDSFYVISSDLPGDTLFVVTADADLGAGVTTITDSVLLHVAGAMAKNFGLTAGTPELK